jgi:hypothetical protein
MVFVLYLTGNTVQGFEFVVYGQKQQKTVLERGDFEKSRVGFKILP